MVVEKILNVKADVFLDEGVVKANFPRTDVKVAVDGKVLEAFRGLTSWAAFQVGSKERVEAMLMGDLVLFEDEVNPAMSAALENAIEVTAMHNPFFFDEPRGYFMHIGGEGNMEALTIGVRRAPEPSGPSERPVHRRPRSGPWHLRPERHRWDLT